MGWFVIFLIATLQTAYVLPADPGITPDNPLYPLDVFFDDLMERLAALFGPDAEAGIKIAHLNERLAELYVMAAQNKTMEVEKVLYHINIKVMEIERLCQAYPRCAMACNATMEKAEKVLQKCLEICPKEARKGLETALENVKQVRKCLRGGWGEGCRCGNCTHACHSAS